MMNMSNSVALPENFNQFQGYIPEPTVITSDGGTVVSSDISKNDVLSGRGKRFNNHFGNVQFRRMVDQHKNKYHDKSNKKIEKSFIAARVVAMVRYLNPTGRFLKQVKNTDAWEEIGDIEARRKARQALRKKKKYGIERHKKETEKDKYEYKPIINCTLNSGFLRKKSDLNVSSSEIIEGPLPYSTLHSYCDKSSDSRDSTLGSDLLSDDFLDFEIDIPGVGEDNFDCLPKLSSKLPLKSSAGLRQLSLNSTETENLKGIRTNSIDTFSQTSFERWSFSVVNDFLHPDQDSRKALFVW